MPAHAKPRIETVALLSAIALAAIAIRVVSAPHITPDYTGFLLPWMSYIDSHGGFLALGDTFANYNVPYLYLLVIGDYLPLKPLYAIKVISCVGDIVLAYAVYRVVALRYAQRWVPMTAAVVVLLLPTVWMNSALWGQADSLYTLFAVGGVYQAMRRKPWLASFLLGCSLAFKLQAIFILPLLLVLALVRYFPWRTLLAVPGAYALLALPALLVGHSPRDLLMVYADQTSLDPRLTANAPSVYQFFRIATGVDTLKLAGIVFAGVAVLLVTLAVVASGRPMDERKILLLATTYAVLIPFLLPGMHERYFYPADILTVALFFWAFRAIWIAIAVQTASALSYVAFLFRTKAGYAVSVDQRILAAVMAAALFGLLAMVVREFRLLGLLRQARTAQAVQPPIAGPRESPEYDQPLDEQALQASA
jgi:Gpi18-like mannosyltransferase